MAIKIQGNTIIDDGRNIVNAGITTVTSVSIGNTQVISSERQLQNIASFDVVTKATIEDAISNTSNTFSNLTVTGISTLGVTSSTNLTAQQLNVTGIVTATSFSGNSSSATYASTAGVATALQNSRTFEITGDIIASSISFDGTGNVSLAATIQPNSVALGGDTIGDYVQSITGTSNQITVTSGTGEGSSPTLSIPNQFTAPQDITVTRDLQVNRNLNVNGNITIGGTSATLFTSEFKVYDPDIVLGFRTDALGNDISTDNTANHGGIAIASTEGTPLISLYDVGVGETNPSTYKKFMWFKSGTFSGLGTDAWISNYAIGIGSTQVPNGVRLSIGGVQFTENDLSVVRDINASGVVTATSFVKSGGTSSQFLKADGSVDTNAYLTSYTETDTLDNVLSRGNVSGIGISVGISTVNNRLSIISTDGNTGRIDLYCETNNAHYTRVQAAPHSEYSGNAIVILPTVSGDIIVGDTSSTISQNLNTTGIITASSFSGSGSNLTGIPLDSDFTINGFMKRTGAGTYTVDSNTYLTTTGSGTNLTGIVTSIVAGSGISIDQTTGRVTITNTSGGGGGESYWTSTSAGIHTLSNVGIGTTNPTSALTVSGDGKFTGIVTATSFVGDLVGTAATSNFATTSYYLDGQLGSYYLDYDNFTNTPTNLSSFSNDVGFVTSSIVVGLASEGYVNNLVAISTFSGDYNDLINQPSIPSIVGLASEGYVDNKVAISTSGLLQINGNGSSLTGVVTSITAGSGISINQSTGNVTITNTGGGGGGASVSVGATPPVSPSSGDLWYNTNLLRTFIYYNDGDSSQWVDASPFNYGESTIGMTKNVSSYIATESQTTFNATYTVGFVDVYMNGVKLSESQYTADTGTSVILNEGASLSDVVEIVGFVGGINGVGIATAGGIVGTGVTLFDFRGPGISTVTVSSGIGTINIAGKLTIGTRTTAETINLIGPGVEILLRSGIGTLNF